MNQYAGVQARSKSIADITEDLIGRNPYLSTPLRLYRGKEYCLSEIIRAFNINVNDENNLAELRRELEMRGVEFGDEEDPLLLRLKPAAPYADIADYIHGAGVGVSDEERRRNLVRFVNEQYSEGLVLTALETIYPQAREDVEALRTSGQIIVREISSREKLPPRKVIFPVIRSVQIPPEVKNYVTANWEKFLEHTRENTVN